MQSTNDDEFTTLIPHHTDVPKHHALCRGRPLWYLLMQSPPFQSYVQNRWLDALFPVVAAAATSNRQEPADCGASSAARCDAEGCKSPPRESVSMAVLGISAYPPQQAAGDDGSTIPEQPVVHKKQQYCDYAQAPFNDSAQRAAVLRGGAHDIPTAFPNMSCKREQLLKAFKSLVSGPAVHVTRYDDAPAQRSQAVTGGPQPNQQPGSSKFGRAAGVGGVRASDHNVVPTNGGSRNAAPSGIKGLSLNPNSRVTSTMLLREEIARTRQAQSMPATAPELVLDTASQWATQSAVATRTDADRSGVLLSTPMQSRYRMWIATNRTRTQQDRYGEVSHAVAQAMREPGPMATMQSLVEPAVLHPIAAHKADLERVWQQHGGGGLHDLEPTEDAAARGGDTGCASMAFVNRHCYDPSEIALLELTVFGYLPTSALKQLGTAGGSARRAPLPWIGCNVESSALPHLRTAPMDLAKARHTLRKRDILDRAVTVELLLRHGGIKKALRCWWSCLPKHMRPQSPSGTSRQPQDILSRATFDQVMVHIHCALVGGSLPLSAQSILDALKQLARDDWVYLFASYANATASGSTGHSCPTPQTEQFRSLLLRGMECPMCLDAPLFNVALLLLIEPWMETTVPEERELALALLFQRCFVRRDDGPPPPPHAPAADVFQLRPLHDDDGGGGASPVRPRSACAGAGHSRSSPEANSRDVASRRPPQHPIKPLTELAEQLDAAMDRRLAAKQAARNRMEGSDTTQALTADAWRSEVLQHNLRQAYRNPHSASTTGEQPLMKPFSPHDPSRSFGLERVMLQRLTKHVVSGCTDATAHRTSTTTEQHNGVRGGWAAAEQANIVVHAAKRLIPHRYLHDVARYHRSVVESFRASVAMALNQYHRDQGAEEQHVAGMRANDADEGDGGDAESYQAHERRGRSAADGGQRATPSPLVPDEGHLDAPVHVESCLPGAKDVHSVEPPFCPPQLVDVQELAAYLAPPTLRGYEKHLQKDAPSTTLSRYFVRRPRSATPSRVAEDTSELIVSESIRRPLSALQGEPAVAPRGRADHRSSPTRPLSAACSGPARGANVAQRPLSAAQRIATQQSRRPRSTTTKHPPPVMYVSPYMRCGALPVSNGDAYVARRRPVSAATAKPQ